MKKKKAILKIDSWSNKDGLLTFYVNDLYLRSMIDYVVELCTKKHGGYMKLEISPPYRQRSTGQGSQNNKIWGMITQICKETGYNAADMEEYAKKRATVRGYPYTVNPLTGDIKYASMADINTVEASYLIDELYVIAAEAGVEIYEGD